MNHVHGKIASHEFGPELPRIQSEEGNQKQFTLSVPSNMVAPSTSNAVSFLPQTEMSCEYKMHTVVPRLSTKENTDYPNNFNIYYPFK